MNKTKSGNVGNEMVPVGRQSDLTTRSPDQTRGPDTARVAQLEQNIRFLQEQHQLMLSGLHKEIDNLRHRNRGRKSKRLIDFDQVYVFFAHDWRNMTW